MYWWVVGKKILRFGLCCVGFGCIWPPWVCEGFWVLPSWTLLLVEADGQRHEGLGNHGEETENRRRERLMKERKWRLRLTGLDLSVKKLNRVMCNAHD